MRRILLIVSLLVAGAATVAASAGADDAHTYKIEMYNAFGIVEGSQVRVAGVNAGTVEELDINEDKRALLTVELTGEMGTLGEDTECSSEPQSLIAEYFIDCEPAGPPLPENGTIPASQVSQTVQQDLVNNTLREPFKRRLQLLINEFGTALAGNPEALNEAIRLGAPALTELRKVTKILASQNRIIRDLNADSDQVIGRLTERSEDVVRFVQEARDTAEASAARRADLSRDFEILDDFLAELDPTLADLEALARQQTPLLTDLRAAAPGLNTLATGLQPFNRAGDESLTSLGDASVVGRRALARGRDEIRLLADASRGAPVTAEALADFVRDIDDPRRSVEIDERAARDTGRTNPAPGQPDTKGYTGFESLLNWLYYIVGTTAQFDQVAHTMHINLNEFESGPCGHVSTGRDHQTGEVGVPAQDGGTTTNILEAARCIQWMGPNQPGITEPSGLPPYDPAVCPNGTEPEAALALCNPGGRSQRASQPARGGRGDGGGGQGAPGDGGAAGAAPGEPGGGPDNVLDDILDLPNNVLEDLGGTLDETLGGLGGGGQSGGQAGGGGVGSDITNDAQDLLDFLFGN
jgi:virulence factor Mce-like protein